jgi:KamA family protein/D-alanine--D-alanine ligase
MKVAVVRNRNHEGIINRFGRPCPEVYGKKSVQMVLDALIAGGHSAALFEGDKRLIANLEQFMPPESATGRPGGMVFNMSYGIQGDCRYAHIPGMLEMAGVPYTGSTPLGHALALDKVVTKILMQDAGVPTPRYLVMSRPDQLAGRLNFPLMVKPRHESTSYGLHFVQDQDELEQAVHDVVTKYQQDALVEEYIDGREVNIGILGNDPPEPFPIVEIDFGHRQPRAMTRADKYHKSADEPAKICPAPLSGELARRLCGLALATFRACRCRDYARIDIRLDPEGNPFVLEINSMASLGATGSFVLAAEKAGYSFASLVCRILDVAHQRYFGVPAPLDTAPAHADRQEMPRPGPAISPNTESTETVVCSQAVFTAREPAGNCRLPYKVNSFYEEQIRRSGCYDRLKLTVEPALAEFESMGVLDSSGECENTKLAGLQHKYPRTALLLVTDQCFAFCRFCFRKRILDKSSEEIVRDYGQVSAYIREHPDITDVLLSGGDPFVLDSEQLQRILDHLLPIPHLKSIRFGTKAIVNYPPRFRDSGLNDLFRRISLAGKTPVVMTHINHIGEISEDAELAIRKLRRLDVQFFNQTVLLKAVNDDPDILASTFARLHALGVRPYYLFQARPVQGASHFQVPLRRGIEISHALDERLSGIQKTHRYVMSHRSGKIELLDINQDNRVVMRYHQSTEAQKVGEVFTRPHTEGACWLDDLQETA